MPRSIGSGMITFGLVSVPIKLYTATSDESYGFTNLHAACKSQIKMPKWCPTCDKAADELVKAVKVGNEFIEITPEDMETLPLRSSKAIEIEGFISEDDLPLLRLEKTAYVGPDDSGKVGQKPYKLLWTALNHSGKVAVARMARSGKESLVVIRCHGQLLALSYLCWPNEVRDTSEIEGTLEDVQLSEAEIGMAGMLVEAMPDAYEVLETATDGYREAMQAVLDAKMLGKAVTPVALPVKPAGDDLMAALQASVAAIKKGAA